MAYESMTCSQLVGACCRLLSQGAHGSYRIDYTTTSDHAQAGILRPRAHWRDLLRPMPADVRQSAGTDVPSAGIAFLPETPPLTSRADPPGWSCAGSQSPSKPQCP